MKDSERFYHYGNVIAGSLVIVIMILEILLLGGDAGGFSGGLLIVWVTISGLFNKNLRGLIKRFFAISLTWVILLACFFSLFGLILLFVFAFLAVPLFFVAAIYLYVTSWREVLRDRQGLL